jgi:cytochrome oxidase Cu insertion factor (SCO1/SenC/PrrC family)
MKNLFKTLVIIVFFGLLSFIVLGILKKIKENQVSEEKISTLPNFSLPDLNGNIFSTSTIRKGPVLLVRFHPECEHCSYELNEIFHSGLTARGVMVLLVSSAPANDVASFLGQFDVGKTDRIISMTDTAYALADIFSRNVIPSNYIYNKELMLVKALYGEYKIGTILKYLEPRE